MAFFQDYPYTYILLYMPMREEVTAQALSPNLNISICILSHINKMEVKQ